MFACLEIKVLREENAIPKVLNQFVFLKTLYVCMFRNQGVKGKRKELEKSYFVLLFLGRHVELCYIEPISSPYLHKICKYLK